MIYHIDVKDINTASQMTINIVSLFDRGSIDELFPRIRFKVYRKENRIDRQEKY